MLADAGSIPAVSTTEQKQRAPSFAWGPLFLFGVAVVNRFRVRPRRTRGLAGVSRRMRRACEATRAYQRGTLRFAHSRLRSAKSPAPAGPAGSAASTLLPIGEHARHRQSDSQMPVPPPIRPFSALPCEISSPQGSSQLSRRPHMRLLSLRILQP